MEITDFALVSKASEVLDSSAVKNKVSKREEATDLKHSGRLGRREPKARALTMAPLFALGSSIFFIILMKYSWFPPLWRSSVSKVV